MRAALTVAATSLRRTARDRVALFFMVLLPVVVILIIGVTVGGYTGFRIGLVSQDSDPVATELAGDLAATPGATVWPYEEEGSARTALRRGELDAVLVVPAGTTAALRAGRNVSLPVLAGGAESTQQAVRTAVAAAVGRHAARVQAARFAVAQAGGTLDQRLAAAARLQGSTAAVAVRTETVDSRSNTLPSGYGYSAPTMLVLFVFVNALAAGGMTIHTRQLGIYDRAMAAPVRAWSIVLGDALCYFCLALLQSVLIVAVGALVFGVSWGAPVAAAALVASWALVGTGAGMLSGTLFRTAEQASAIGPALGIALGMLGGCMWPLSVVSPLMQRIGHLVPQSWAVDSWTVLLSQGGGVADIAGRLGLLAGFGGLLLVLASLRLRGRLTG